MHYAENRKAKHDYEQLESYDAGLVLSGQEVKAIREGGANLTGSYLSFDKGELWLKHARIAPYSKAGLLPEYDPERPRKVLMHKRELRKIFDKNQQKGLTLIPFSLYPRARQVKLNFSLCKGKTAYDKRDSLKQKAIAQDLRRQDA